MWCDEMPVTILYLGFQFYLMKLRQDDRYSLSASHSIKTLEISVVDDDTCLKRQAKKPKKPH